MEVCSTLWAAGIKAEFGFKANPKMGDQLNYCLEQAIPFMVGGRGGGGGEWPQGGVREEWRPALHGVGVL